MEANDKNTSRKWRCTVWALIMASIIVIAGVVAPFFKIDLPSWLGVFATTCASTGIAYIGGNVYQKTHAEGNKE